MKAFYKNDPQKLASDKKVIPLHEFLKDSKETIIESLIEKEVYEISYRKIGERIQYISDRFELDLVLKGNEITSVSNNIAIEKISEIFAIRNVIVHNDGIINSLFLKTVRKKNYLLGQKIHVDTDMINNIMRDLLMILTSVHRQIELRYS